LAPQLSPQFASDAAPEVSATGRGSRPRFGHDRTAAELYRALAATQRRLGAALRQIDTLRIQDSLLKKQVVLLEAAAATARQFAYHDELTRLPNRRLLLDHFNQAIARGARRHGQVAILLLDLDGFKSINDALGHTAGDKLLQQVATRITACIRTSDTACRFGGDEFVILLPELEGEQSAVAVAEKIRAHLTVPYFIDGTAIKITISMGIATYPVDGEEYAKLIRRADHEMYRDKARRAVPPSVSEGGAHVCPIAATRASVAS
jgi:diguanylate cyclase